MALIEFTSKGLCCPQGGFYLDPWHPVDKAIITHAHSDHARPGNRSYLSHHHTKPLLEARLGAGNYESIEWGEPVFINGVRVSLHPAGHMIGSSQVRLEYKGEVWVFSGDYKTTDDGISGCFEPVQCHTFITESTFGLPIFRWKPQTEIFQQMKEWVGANRANGKTSVVLAYSLGKAQRILSTLAETTDIVLVHGAISNMHQVLVNAGWQLPPVERITADTPKDKLRNAVVLAPPGAAGSSWIRRLQPFALGVCSGWMQVRGNVRRKNVDGGFVISDHADWDGLLDAVRSTGASQVYVTHGYQAAFSRYLNENGIAAAEVKTEYGEDEESITRDDQSEEASSPDVV